MRLPNGYGTVFKLTGKRRKPYVAKVTVEIQFDEKTKKYSQKQKALGYYSTKKEALEALANYNHDPYDLNILTVTFDDVYEKVTFPEASLKNYEAAYKYLNPIKDMYIRDIKSAHMQECIDSCETTQQGLIKTICKKVYAYALKNEYIDKNPSQYLTSVTKQAQIERKMFTHDEVEKLWGIDEWWAKFTLMMLYSGMRTKELRLVPVENIDLENRWLTLSAAKNECSIRGIPIHKRTIPLFSDYKVSGGNLYGWSHSYLNKYLYSFYGHRAHDTRHSFTTRMREIGTDHLVIKRLIGHTPTDITERIYTHLTQEELTEAIDKLEY